MNEQKWNKIKISECEIQLYLESEKSERSINEKRMQVLQVTEL